MNIVDYGKIKKGCGNTNPGIYCKNLKCDYCDELKAKNKDNRLPEINKLSVKDFKLWFDGFYSALKVCNLIGGDNEPLDLIKSKITELE